MFGERVLEGKLLSTMCAGISGGGEDDKGVEKNDSQIMFGNLGGWEGEKREGEECFSEALANQTMATISMTTVCFIFS